MSTQRWMSGVVFAFGAIGATAPSARAAPAEASATAVVDRPQRLVLVQPRTILRDAVTRAVAPWAVEVTVSDQPTAELPEAALALATATAADVVVWLRPGMLVVYRRVDGAFQHRPATSAPLDDASAAAIALSLKTALALPPISTTTPAIHTPPPRITPEPPSLRRWLLAVELSGSATLGGTIQDVAPRFALTAGVRVLGRRALHVLLRADAGTGSPFSKGNFDGRWSEVGASLGAAWVATIGPVDVGPVATIGLRRASLTGSSVTEGDVDRTEIVGTVGLDALVIYRAPFGVSLWPMARLGVARRWGETSLLKGPGNGVLYAPGDMTVDVCLGVQYAY